MFKSLDKNKYQVYTEAPLASQWMMFNLAKPDFQDLRLRKALSLAIDRGLISNNVYDGLGILDSMGVTMPGPDWRLSQDELKKLLPDAKLPFERPRIRRLLPCLPAIRPGPLLRRVRF